MVCHKKTGKRQLVRLVRVSDSNVEVDITGRKPGRGAYLCPALSCWEQAFNTGRLDYSLHTCIKQEVREKLISYAKSIEEKGAN